MHPQIPSPGVDRPVRGLMHLLSVVLVVTFITGGGSQDYGPGDAIAQLLALPLLAWSVFALGQQPLTGMVRLALALAVVVVAIPLLQLLPLPAWAWQASPARMALARDLSVAGVAAPATWSLTPDATRQAVLALVPPISVFLCVLAISRRERVRLLWIFLALVLFSLLLGLVQLGLPQDSLLNPFPQWAPALGGVFANPSHQAITLACGVVVALSMLLGQNGDDGGRHDLRLVRRWGLGACCALFLLGLPLTGSRGGVLIGVLAIALVPVAVGVFSLDRLRSNRRLQWGLAAIVCLALMGVWVSLQWIQVDAVSETRWSLTQATTTLGFAHAPWGAGIGSFVPLFEQDGPASMLGWEYINHAHNEYAQLWLEGGVPAMLALGGALLLIAFATTRLLKMHPHRRVDAMAALVCLLALLAHSWVDYPLRTQALMTIAALMAGIVIASAGGSRRGEPSRLGTAAGPWSPQSS